MTIYENERLIVTTTNNASKVTISDKFAPIAPLTVNKDAFEEMCKGVAEKLKENELSARA